MWQTPLHINRDLHGPHKAPFVEETPLGVPPLLGSFCHCIGDNMQRATLRAMRLQRQKELSTNAMVVGTVNSASKMVSTTPCAFLEATNIL